MGKAADRVDVGRLGDLARGGDDAVGHALAVHLARAFDDLAIGRVAFDRLGDIVHRLDGLDGVVARRAFGRKHHRIRALIDRRGDVRDLGPRRHRAFDHAFEHLRGHDHRLGLCPRCAHQALLDRRHRMDRQFHPQIAPRHHDPVRGVEDRGKGLHRRGLLDLRQDRGAPARKPARLDHVLGALHEGQRQPVDAQFAGEFQIAAVLFRQGGQRQHHVGDVHALAVGNRAARGHGTVGEILAAAFDAQADLAVIDQKRGTGFQRRENLRVGQVHAIAVALGRVEVEAEGIAFFKVMGARREGPDP